MNLFPRICISLAILLVIFVETSSISAQPLEPVPLYGAYHMYLDRSKQTFNGHTVATDRPLTQTENFTTYCDSSGCVARSPNKRPPPAFFDYHWVSGHWESVPGQQHQFLICNDGSKVNSVKFDVIKPNGQGSFLGERTILVDGAGCPGEGPGKYWLPFTLTAIIK